MNDFSEKIKDLQARLNLYKEAMTKLAQQINELTALILICMIRHNN
jgi:prefoldin subunit 5